MDFSALEVAENLGEEARVFVTPRQRCDLYIWISVSGLGSLRLGGCWPFAAPTIVEAAEAQPPGGLFPGR